MMGVLARSRHRSQKCFWNRLTFYYLLVLVVIVTNTSRPKNACLPFGKTSHVSGGGTVLVSSFVLLPQHKPQQQTWIAGSTTQSRTIRKDQSNLRTSNRGSRAAIRSSSTSNTRGKKNNPNVWKEKDASLLHRAYTPDRVPKDIDYIIIGSGIGGLWLGACLSKFGYQVLVLEQHYIAGGLQHTFTIQGYEFVPGLHYIANLKLCKPLYDMVADPEFIQTMKYHQAGNTVPADFRVNATTKENEPYYSSHDIKIGTLPIMHVREGYENVKNELIQHFPKEERAITQFLQIMEKAKWQAGQFATFRIFPRWLQFIMSQLLCSTYIKYASMTTEEALSTFTNDGRLKTVLSAFGGDLGENIREGSFVMQAAVLGHVVEGCYYPEGGPIQFARGLIPPIRKAGGDVLVKAQVEQILIEDNCATGVRLVNTKKTGKNDTDDDEILIRCKKGVISDAGMLSTLTKLVPKHLIQEGGPLADRYKHVMKSSGGISHVFTFVGLNATNEELGLKSSSFYYIPWNATNADMDASEIQDFYRDTLLDPNVQDVSAGIVFVTAKDPHYSSITMPGRATAIIFSEAKDTDFTTLLDNDIDEKEQKPYERKHQRQRRKKYYQAKELVEKKMLRSLLINFPHLEPYIDVVSVGTPLTMEDFTFRTETLGLRHTPTRMCDMELRPDCDTIQNLYFTGQDVSFAGWAGALSGAMITAQKLLNYTLFDFMNKKTLMRDLGRGDVEDMIQQKVKDGSGSNAFDTVLEIAENAIRHIKNGGNNKI